MMRTGTTYLLDTNIVSQLMRNAQGVVAQRYRFLLEKPEPCRMVTSVVVQCELLYGLVKKPSDRLQAAYTLQMEQLPVLDLDQTVTAHYANVRTQLELAGTPIGPNDTLIAAHALALGATLVTADAEFNRVPGLKVENWLERVIDGKIEVIPLQPTQAARGMFAGIDTSAPNDDELPAP